MENLPKMFQKSPVPLKKIKKKSKEISLKKMENRIFREALVERNSTDFVAHTSDVTSVCIGLKSHEIIASGGKDCKVNVWKINPTQEKSSNNVVNMWTFGVSYLLFHLFSLSFTH